MIDHNSIYCLVLQKPQNTTLLLEKRDHHSFQKLWWYREARAYKVSFSLQFEWVDANTRVFDRLPAFSTPYPYLLSHYLLNNEPNKSKFWAIKRLSKFSY